MPTYDANEELMRQLTLSIQYQDHKTQYTQRPYNSKGEKVSTVLMNHPWLDLRHMARIRAYEDEKNDRDNAYKNQKQKDEDAFSSPEPDTQFELDEDRANQTSESGTQLQLGCQ